jgi:Xaa-Pro dipeptidase
MQRRNFLKTTATASALATLAPMASFAQSGEKNFSEDEIKKLRDRIKPITKEERQHRIAQAQELMHENNIDAILMEGGTSLNYFTGANWGRSERLFAMILPKNGKPSFVAPKFEEARAKEQTGDAKLFTWLEDESPYKLIREILKQNNFLTGSLGIEETTRYFVTENISKAIPTLRIQSATPVTAGCRSVKSAHEIELMQIANDITAAVFLKAKTKLQTGMSENNFAEIVSNLFAEFGTEGGALVLFGKASAHPHGLREENKLNEGDIVLIDGGCSVEGYESDITRTTVFGTPTEKMKTIWQHVRNAQDAGLKTAKPNIEAGQVDAAARKIIGDAGFGNDYSFFTHRLGHGIGMDGHEWNYLVRKNKYLLKPGNMFSNEPGIYIIGEFGIRLEDEMLITENGAKLLLPQAQSLEKIF